MNSDLELKIEIAFWSWVSKMWALSFVNIENMSILSENRDFLLEMHLGG